MGLIRKMRWFAGLLVLFCSYNCSGAVQFSGEFAPHEGLVKNSEAEYRSEICLNGKWDFQGMEVPENWKSGIGDPPELKEPDREKWNDVKIKIPSPWNVNGYYKGHKGPDFRAFPRYPEKWEDYKMGWMKRTVKIPTGWSGKEIILDFQAVAGYAEVYVNGEKVCENFDLFLPFEADITEYAQPGEEIEILAGVRKASLFNDERTVGRRIIPCGSMWGQFAVGIWQDVYLLALPKVRIQDVYVKPKVSEDVLELDVTVKNDTDESKAVSVDGIVQKWIDLSGKDAVSAAIPKSKLGKEVLTVPSRQVEISAGSSEKVTVSVPVENRLDLWSPESPNLYGLTLSLENSGTQIDSEYQRFGWRQWSIEGDKYCLNGEPVEFRADSWHFQGIPQMTRRYAWAWYKAIKNANGNAVRLHAQVFPEFYLDVADEMGICVLDETAIWASDGGIKFDSEEFWESSREHIRRLVLRDRNHASVLGWSVSNENKPLIHRHILEDPGLLPRQVKAWKKWLEICNENDPTRPWVSGDGEADGEGTLPIVIGHYGDINSMKRWASHGKPWGVGEHSMGYYGTPEQVSKYNGTRAYESQRGRMEGIAYESYKLISDQRRLGATYSSVFNIAWYALKPLALGLEDTSKSPTLNDGIFFTGSYKEGKPGVQPERIGPYCTTFNPGYDPDLPLYKPWPMFEAIKHANAKGGPADSKWAEMPDKTEQTEVSPASERYESVIFIGAEDGSLKQEFESRGVVFDNSYKGSDSRLVIIDGKHPVSKQGAEKIEELIDDGCDIWVWGITPQTESAFNRILPHQIEVTEREASSLLVQSQAPVIAGLDHSDFYFCEIQEASAMKYGLKGAFVDRGEVILSACDTDWNRWKGNPEPVKTASVLRSEREAKPAGNAMVRYITDKGCILINTMTDFYESKSGKRIFRTMLENAGVPLE